MRLILLAFLTTTLIACSQTTTDPAKEARAAFEEYVAALNSGDIDKAAAMYDSGDGFHWIERGGVQYDKGEKAAASLRSLSASGGKSEMKTDDVRVASMGDSSALVSAHFDYAMLDDTGKEQFSFDGWMTIGMVKRANGWKIVGGQTGPGKTQ